MPIDILISIIQERMQSKKLRCNFGCELLENHIEGEMGHGFEHVILYTCMKLSKGKKPSWPDWKYQVQTHWLICDVFIFLAPMFPTCDETYFSRE